MATLSGKSNSTPTETEVSLTFQCETSGGRIYRSQNQVGHYTDPADVVSNEVENVEAIAGPIQFDLDTLTAGEQYYHDVVQDTEAGITEGYNWLPESEDFSTWTNANSIALTPAQSGPLGSTATLLVDQDNDAAGWLALVSPQITLTTVDTWCFSLYAKANTALTPLNDLSLQSGVVWSPNHSRSFMLLSTGSLGSKNVNHASHGFSDEGSGWYRYWITFVPDSANGNAVIQIASGASTWLTQDGTQSIIIDGAQLEKGNTPSPYTKTEGTPSTP